MGIGHIGFCISVCVGSLALGLGVLLTPNGRSLNQR